MSFKLLLALLSMSMLAAAFPALPDITPTMAPLATPDNATTATDKNWTSGICRFHLKLRQICYRSFPDYHLQTFAAFTNFKDGAGHEIQDLTGATPDSTNVDSKPVFEIHRPDGFYMRWKYYEWTSGKTLREKMTFAFGGKDHDDLSSCNRGDWTENNKDLGMYKYRCIHEPKMNTEMRVRLSL